MASSGPGRQSESSTELGLSSTEQLLELFRGYRLSPTHRRIAHFLVENPTEAATLSSVELAQRVGVSQPSVTRFSAAVGMHGFPELRERLREVMLGRSQAPPGEVRRNEYQQAIGDQIAHLDALKNSLDARGNFATLGRSLMESEPLIVFGTRISMPLASYFAYCARKFHRDVRLCTRSDTSGREELVRAHSEGGAWVIAFLMPRYPRESVELLKTAQQMGMQLALITDSALFPLARNADAILPCQVNSRLVFDSYAGPMAMATILLEAMCDAFPSATQSRLEEFEEFARQNRVFTRE